MDEYKIEMQEEVGSSAIREIDLDGETRELPAKPLRMRETDEPANAMFPKGNQCFLWFNAESLEQN